MLKWKLIKTIYDAFFHNFFCSFCSSHFDEIFRLYSLLLACSPLIFCWCSDWWSYIVVGAYTLSTTKKSFFSSCLLLLYIYYHQNNNHKNVMKRFSVLLFMCMTENIKGRSGGTIEWGRSEFLERTYLDRKFWTKKSMNWKILMKICLNFGNFSKC